LGREADLVAGEGATGEAQVDPVLFPTSWGEPEPAGLVALAPAVGGHELGVVSEDAEGFSITAEFSGSRQWLLPGERQAVITAALAEGWRGSSLKQAGKICCDRPGCYEHFEPTRRSPAQRFCGKPCRRALERVRQREARWRERHAVERAGHAVWRARVRPEVLNRV
jgi:hypothetical protein